MNPNSFSLLGYLSVALWVSVPVFWWLSRRMRSARWICPLALLVALLAFGLAKVNSDTHVDRIAPDRKSEVEKKAALEEAKRKAMEESRGEDVANIRFAEDGAGDFLDVAGMDEADLKYMKSLQEDGEPEWKREKKKRGEGGVEDDSLESKLGGDEAIQGVEAEEFAEKEEKPPILMSDGEMAMAHRLDGWNLSASKWVIVLAVVMLVIDYLARGNVYSLAYFPLPVPSSWKNAFHPRPVRVDRGKSPRRSLEKELEWLARQGDCFILFTDDLFLAESLPKSLPRLKNMFHPVAVFLSWLNPMSRSGFRKLCRPIEILHAKHPRVNDDFAFEALWFGSCSVVVHSPDRAMQLFDRIVELLQNRRERRAQVRQNAHVLWDLDSPPRRLEEFERAAGATGISLMLCRDAPSFEKSSTI